MFPGKNFFDQLIKSTLMTLSLSTLFDMMSQGYLTYHNIFICIIVLGFVTHVLYKYYQQNY